jgi:hypothetical protein
MTTRRTSQTDPPAQPSDAGAEWRWRNYTERLTELGYDLLGGRGDSEEPPRPTPRDTSEPLPSRT